MPGFSYEQLTRVPFVMKMISEYQAPGTTFQRFYNIGLTDRPSQTLPHRSGVYDIFNPTRSMPVSRAPMSGPARVARKPVGQKAITVPRFYEAMIIEDEYVFRNRPLGGQYGIVDEQGQSYIARQIKHEVTKFYTLHEFMAVQSMRGGWALKRFGEDLLPVPMGTAGAELDFTTLVSSEVQGQIPLGGAAGDQPIITSSWDDPSTDIIEQILNLDKVHARRHGAPLRHVWGNATTIGPLFNNTNLAKVGGTSFRIYDRLTKREVDPGQRYPDTGVDIVFRAYPLITFHIYNQVYIPGLVHVGRDAQTDMDNIQYLIPDNEVIITPDPDDWIEKVAGTEPVQFSLNEAPRYASGFVMGRSREIEPPRWDLKFMYNGAPVLVQPSSIYNPTVIFS